MSRGTFYRCFDSLESVLDEIYGLWHAELTGAVARVLEMYDDPRQMIVSRLDDALSMAVEVGPVLRTLYREEMRPGSPFFGAQQARQRAQAEMVVVWWRKRYGNDIDPVAVQVLIMSVLKIAVHVCDSGNLQPGELDTIKTAARAMCLGALESVISSEQPRGDT